MVKQKLKNISIFTSLVYPWEVPVCYNIDYNKNISGKEIDKTLTSGFK